MTTANKPGATTLHLQGDREVVLTRSFDAPRQLVWDAYTRPEHLQKWMLGPDGWSMPVCEHDLRDGGTHRMVWRKSDGAEMEIKGSYREVTPPVRIVSTESWGPDWPETVNTLVFSEANGRTTVTTTILYSSKEIREAALKTGMKEGMEMSYSRLEAYLATLA